MYNRSKLSEFGGHRDAYGDLFYAGAKQFLAASVAIITLLNHQLDYFQLPLVKIVNMHVKILNKHSLAQKAAFIGGQREFINKTAAINLMNQIER